MCHNWNECCWESNKCCVFWSPSLYDRWDLDFFARPCNPSQRYTHIIASAHQVHPSASAHIHVWKTNDQWDDQKGWKQAKSYLGVKLKVSTQETGENVRKTVMSIWNTQFGLDWNMGFYLSPLSYISVTGQWGCLNYCTVIHLIHGVYEVYDSTGLTSF